MTDLPNDNERDSRATSTVAKVVGIIQAVSRAGGPIGVRELSRVSGIDRSAVSRIAASLRQLGVLAASNDGSCSPGPELWALSDRLRRSSSLDVESARVVELVSAATDETAFSLVGEKDAQYVAHVAVGRGPVTVLLDSGSASPFIGTELSMSTHPNAPSMRAAIEGAICLGREVGRDEWGRTWSMAVAIPDQRADPNAVNRATEVLESAISDLRRVTPVVAR